MWPARICIGSMMLLVIIVAIIVSISPRKIVSNETTTNQSEVSAEQITEPAPVVQAEQIVTNDGYVIVRDKGASVTMAPANRQQPVFVSEQEVRSRSRNATN